MTPPGAAADRLKTRRSWRIAWVGALTALGVSLVTGVLGTSGRLGLVVALLGSALACGVAALYAIGSVLADELRDRPTSRGRPVAAVVLFVAAALLMAMVAGAGG